MGGLGSMMGGMDGMPARVNYKPVKSDIKYIICDTCKAMVKRVVFRADEFRKEGERVAVIIAVIFGLYGCYSNVNSVTLPMIIFSWLFGSRLGYVILVGGCCWNTLQKYIVV